ncbi:MAG: PEP/pyruvate-binding domain-containing protein [Kofleriaceae bacterium]
MHRAVDLALATACGGKADGLARLVAAGLPVPPGFVLPPATFVDVVGPAPTGVALADLGAALAALAAHARAVRPPPALADEVCARAAALGPRVIVRSSMSLEDAAAGAGPGVGVSRVVPAAAVWDAIREVWAAALTPLVAVYARARDLPVAAPAVIVQAFVPGYRATVYTRPPGQPADDTCWIACGPGAPAQVARTGPGWRDAVALALAAEGALARATGVDVELVWSFASRTWQVVQARPLIHPPPTTRRPAPPPVMLAALRASGQPWRRDVTHNPTPLSVAQAGLCARVDGAAVAPFALAVVGHHLYWAPRPGAPVPEVPPSSTLAARLAERERAAAAILARPPRDLADALAIYLAAYQVLASELGPLIAAARAVLPDALAARGRSAPRPPPWRRRGRRRSPRWWRRARAAS